MLPTLFLAVQKIGAITQDVPESTDGSMEDQSGCDSAVAISRTGNASSMKTNGSSKGEGITLLYKATSRNKLRRVAIIRRARVVDHGQTRLIFDTDWQYEAIATNLEWEPIDLWRFYNQLCCMVNYIQEAKCGFSIDRIATSDFEANELDLLIKLLNL